MFQTAKYLFKRIKYLSVILMSLSININEFLNYKRKQYSMKYLLFYTTKRALKMLFNCQYTSTAIKEINYVAVTL